MQYLKILALLVTVFFFSCKKENTTPDITGNWKWIYYQGDSPTNYSTPQSTGIQEILSFTNGSYVETQNGMKTNFGAYKVSTVTNPYGQKVSRILFTNSRVADSATYYSFASGNDTLYFSYDLIGTAGSGLRCYARH